jgi:hypothetical protein
MSDRKKTTPIDGHFVALGCELLEAPAWLAMKPHTRLVYIALAQEIRYFKDGTTNNGRVYLSTRMAARRVNISQRAAWSSFEEIEHYGFTVQTTPGVQGKKGRAARRRLTDVALDNPDGTKTAATKDYRDWDGVLYDPKSKRRKAQKVTSTVRQGPDVHRASGSDVPQTSGKSQNGHFTDVPQTSDLNSFPSSCSGDGVEEWQRNARTPEECLPDDDLPNCLRRGHPDCWVKD